MGIFDIFNSPDVVTDELPSEEAVDKALSLTVQDHTGKEHALRSLVHGYGRVILVFVRHNHCGACIQYVNTMKGDDRLRRTTTNEESQRPREEQTRVLIVGHGSFEGIERYNGRADSPFDMYVDSSKRIYHALGLTRRYLGKVDEVPEYFQGMTYTDMVWKSVKGQATSGHLLWKGGDIALLGGEFVFDKDLTCIYAHRMQTTVDHTSVKELAGYALAPTAEQAGNQTDTHTAIS